LNGTATDCESQTAPNNHKEGCLHKVAERSFTALKQAAQTALDCQDAVNLSGVLHSLNEILATVLGPEARRLDQGTAWVNRHPIVTLFLHKLTSLNGSDCFCSECITSYHRATVEVGKIAKVCSDACTCWLAVPLPAALLG